MWCPGSMQLQSLPRPTTLCFCTTRFWFDGWRSPTVIHSFWFAASWVDSCGVIISKLWPFSCLGLCPCWRHRQFRMQMILAMATMRCGTFIFGKSSGKWFSLYLCGLCGSPWSTLSGSSPHFESTKKFAEKVCFRLLHHVPTNFCHKKWLFFENFCDHFRVLSFSLSQELMVQKADVNASLEAARSVLASQCDAEAGKGIGLMIKGESLGCTGIGR